jgi:hypothetical protein
MMMMIMMLLLLLSSVTPAVITFHLKRKSDFNQKNSFIQYKIDAVDLEEGEIDDDVKEDENNKIKKSHKRKRKHKNRKKRKTAIVYEDEVNAYEQV